MADGTGTTGAAEPASASRCSVPYLEATLVFATVVYLFETYLDFRQQRALRVVDRPEELQAMGVTQEQFIKSQAYGLDKNRFGLFSSAFNQIKLTLVLLFGYLPWIWNVAGNITQRNGYTPEHELIQSTVFFLVSTWIDSAISIPFSLYSTFVIEQRHGFNKQTWRLFVTDQIKSQLLIAIIGVPLLSAFLWIIKWGGDNFYIYVWAFVFVVQIVMMTLYPTLIQPCFNKVVPLPEGSLRTKIEELAAHSAIQFPLTALYEIDGSTRSAHSNAYFYGFWKNKRIVLFDTLIKQASEDEVVAILGHELGHWKLNHTLKGLVLAQLHLLAVFVLFGQFMTNDALYVAFGFVDGRMPTVIGFMLFQFVYAPIEHVLEFLMNILSRHHEFQADAFSVGLGKSVELRSALIKLQQENLSTFCPDGWYSMYHYSHPPILERLRGIAETADAGNQPSLVKKTN